MEGSRTALGLADGGERPVGLAEVLGQVEGWRVVGLGLYARVHPSALGTNADAYAQFTAGKPVSGERAVLDAAARRSTNPVLDPFFLTARNFGQSMALRFVHRRLGEGSVTTSHVPFLSAIVDVDEVWGYGWRVFSQAAANNVSASFPGTVVKNMFISAPRNPVELLHEDLRPETVKFLAQDLDATTASFIAFLRLILDRYRTLLGRDWADADDSIVDIVGRLEGIPPRERLADAVMGRRTEQYHFPLFGMTTYVKDTNGGRLAKPLALDELRHFGITGQLSSPQEIRQAADELSTVLRRVYARAQQEPLSPEALRASIECIVGHPLVQAFAPFLELATRSLLPQAVGRPRQRLTPYESQPLAEAVGAFALGSALRPAVHKRLAELVDEMTEQLGRYAPDPLSLPDEVHLRWEPVVAAAREGLALLGPVPDVATMDRAERIAKLRELFGLRIESSPLFPELFEAVARVARLGGADEMGSGLEAAMADVAQYVLVLLDPSVPVSLEKQRELVILVDRAMSEQQADSLDALAEYYWRRYRQGGPVAGEGTGTDAAR